MTINKEKDIKILVVVGSGRKGSYNQIIANYLEERYQEECIFREADLKSLPVYLEDIENDDIASVKKLREDVKWADGVVILTPEHNFTMSVLIKNFIDWCSRVELVLANKPVMITGATMGYFGTVMAQSHVRQAMLSPGVKAVVVPGTEVYLPTIQNRVAEGKLLDENAETLNKAFVNFVEYIGSENRYCFNC